LIGGGGVRLALTALFAVIGACYLGAAALELRGAEQGRGGRALGGGLHVLMSAAMISMWWPWGADIPAIAQVTVFTAAAGWFAGQAIFGGDGQHGGGCQGNWYHAGMMAVMVWLPVAMELMSPPSAGSGMSGMAMPAGGTAGMAMGGQAPAAGAPVTGALGGAGTVSLILAAALFAAAAWQAVTALRPFAAPDHAAPPGAPWPGTAGIAARNGIGALIAAGMAVALLEMA
jgi:hypothetical protein